MSLLVLLLVFSLPAWAADLSEKDSLPEATPSSIYQYEEYTVKKGDTLWGIANERLENPFSWPKVWQVNPKITNADLIYPGQVIRIPIDLLKPKYRKLVKPATPAEPVTEPPIETPVSAPISAKKPVKVEKARYLAKPEFIAAAGFISDDLQEMGTILGSPSEHQLLGRYDRVYVTDNGANKGKKFSLFRKIKKINHPVTGNYLGTLYEILGSLEVTEHRNGANAAKIIDSYNYIEPKSILGEYSELEAVLVSEKPRTPNISGYIVETKELKWNIGVHEVVYLDRGADDGLAVGDVLSISKPEKRFYGEKIGKVQVIKTTPSTTTAVILQSTEEFHRGYVFGPVSEEAE